MSVTVGVLALQGDVREHVAALERVGARAMPVRRPSELDACDGLVLPGGESTTISTLLERFELFEPLHERVSDGFPVFGTCAGMILLASEILDGRSDQRCLGAFDITVRRNAFGRQVDSFEGPVEVAGLESPMHGVFIRAPWVERAGPDVEVLSTVDRGAADRIVAVRQGRALATAFHPEVGEDARLHQMFVELIRS